MNDTIKKLLTKNGCGLTFDDNHPFDIALQQTFIEICQLQIEECAKNDVVPINYKNIAE